MKNNTRLPEEHLLAAVPAAPSRAVVTTRRRHLGQLGRRLAAGLGASLGASWFRAVAARSEAPHRFLYLQPLGDDLPSADVALVERALTAMVGFAVRTLERRPLPPAAFYPARHRYRAEKILDVLDPLLPSDGLRILGLTSVDISTTKGDVFDWGILGLGRIDGASSVISAFRCRRRSRGPQQSRERLAKVAVHETGHTLGLQHCPTPHCLMHDAEGKVSSCDDEYDFCERCRTLLARFGRPLPAAPLIPWPHPAV